MALDVLALKTMPSMIEEEMTDLWLSLHISLSSFVERLKTRQNFKILRLTYDFKTSSAQYLFYDATKSSERMFPFLTLS